MKKYILLAILLILTTVGMQQYNSYRNNLNAECVATFESICVLSWGDKFQSLSAKYEGGGHLSENRLFFNFYELNVDEEPSFVVRHKFELSGFSNSVLNKNCVKYSDVFVCNELLYNGNKYDLAFISPLTYDHDCKKIYSIDLLVSDKNKANYKIKDYLRPKIILNEHNFYVNNMPLLGCILKELLN